MYLTNYLKTETWSEKTKLPASISGLFYKLFAFEV